MNPDAQSRAAAPAQPEPQQRQKRQRSEKSRPSIFWVLAGLIIPLGSLLARFKVTDGDKLPRHGAYIISPNHYSEIDPVMMGMVVWKLGRLPRFLAKESLFRRCLSPAAGPAGGPPRSTRRRRSSMTARS